MNRQISAMLNELDVNPKKWRHSLAYPLIREIHTQISILQLMLKDEQIENTPIQRLELFRTIRRTLDELYIKVGIYIVNNRSSRKTERKLTSLQERLFSNLLDSELYWYISNFHLFQ